MQPASPRKLASKGVILAVLFGCLWLFMAPPTARGDDPVCDPYDEYVCSLTGHTMNWDCTCNYEVCANLLTQTDCSEQGKTLDRNSCQCISYELFCQDWDAEIRCLERGGFFSQTSCSCTPASATNSCNYEQTLYCSSWGGTLDARTCACRFPRYGSVCTASQQKIDACVSNGGTWDYNYCLCRIPFGY